DDPTQALKNLGDLKFWAKNTSASGDPLYSGGTDSKTTETTEQRMARTGESLVDIQFKGAVQDKAGAFAGAGGGCPGT
ncbi:MAG: hypothetical protein HQ525_08190, partial [Anaerolineae bacterium]|nr:hypothetical protein [Anaerolineae bacterium]